MSNSASKKTAIDWKYAENGRPEKVLGIRNWRLTDGKEGLRRKFGEARARFGL